MTGHIRRPGRLRGPAILAALVLGSGLFGPSTLQAADPTPPPSTDHEMFRQPTGTDIGTKAVGGGVQASGVTTSAVASTSITPSGFHETVMFSGLVAPTSIAFAADGRVFIAEKRGTIKVYDSIEDPTPTTYADLRTNVHDFWDRGLLGLAVDPNFTSNGRLYALYTYNHIIGDPAAAPKWTDGGGNDNCPNPPGATRDGCVASARLSVLTANGSGVWTGTEDVLIEDWCTVHPSHSIGTVVFGPDGALYVGAGDGAFFNGEDHGEDLNPADDTTPDNPCGDPPSPVGIELAPPSAEGGALRSQDLRTSGDPAGLDGSIIRINPLTGAAMPDNAQAGNPDANAARIIAYGLRNPFRFTFRPGTSELWIADVGWSTWEEANRLQVPSGPVKNFGWPCYEGAASQPKYNAEGLTICQDLYADGTAVLPYFTYNHASDHVAAGDSCPKASGSVMSAIALYPASGGPFPPTFNGGLFFGDYARNCIWFMPIDGSGLPNPASVQSFASDLGGPVDMKVGPDGGLYYVALNNGTVRRITMGPTTAATATPTFGAAPLQVQFDGSGSSGLPGQPISYAWDLDGDGQFDDSNAVSPTWTYATAGAVLARLRVTDGSAIDIARVVISTEAAPVASISSPQSGLTWAAGDTISFSGSATDAEDGTEPPSRLAWTILIKHCPSACHNHILQTVTGSSGTFTAPDHEYPSQIEIQLVATDAHGVTSAPVTVTLSPRTVDLAFATSPAGIALTVGNVSRTAPFSQTAIAGSVVQVAAPPAVSVGGQVVYFKGWSDGLAATHAVTAAQGAPPLTATYGVAFRVLHRDSAGPRKPGSPAARVPRRHAAPAKVRVPLRPLVNTTSRAGPGRSQPLTASIEAWSARPIWRLTGRIPN